MFVFRFISSTEFLFCEFYLNLLCSLSAVILFDFLYHTAGTVIWKINKF